MTFKVLSENLWQNSRADQIFLQDQKAKQNAAPFNFQVEFEYYDFGGTTYNAAMNDMDIEAAKAINVKTDSGEYAVGIVKPSPLEAKPKSFRHVVNKKIVTAYPVGVMIKQAVKVVLPRYASLAMSGDLEKIRKVVKEITQHERVHVCIALEAFNRVKQAALGLNGKGKSKLEAEKDLSSNWQKTFDAILAEAQIKQKKYDSETDHGRKTVEQEKYNKTVTAECETYYEIT